MLWSREENDLWLQESGRIWYRRRCLARVLKDRQYLDMCIFETLGLLEWLDFPWN